MSASRYQYNFADLSGTSSDTSTIDFTLSYDTSGRYTYRRSSGRRSPSQATCNETKAHNNEEKAFYHGLKSAYRMSREYDGEYGTSDPPWETAARIAAHVSVAYLKVTGEPYDRGESFEYLEENVFDNIGIADRLKQFFAVSKGGTQGPATEEDVELGIGKAWTQVDDKWNHHDAARTALATAEAYLGEEFEI